ncbi:MAG: hypothetical protein ACJAV6_000600, partial [Candidatus Paceibacteria bacterium]
MAYFQEAMSARVKTIRYTSGMNIFDLHQKFKECKQEVSTDTRI